MGTFRGSVPVRKSSSRGAASLASVHAGSIRKSHEAPVSSSVKAVFLRFLVQHVVISAVPVCGLGQIIGASMSGVLERGLQSASMLKLSDAASRARS